MNSNPKSTQGSEPNLERTVVPQLQAAEPNEEHCLCEVCQVLHDCTEKIAETNAFVKEAVWRLLSDAEENFYFTACDFEELVAMEFDPDCVFQHAVHDAIEHGFDSVPAPARIQRQRTKGWRKPENTVCVSRPGKWGNPFALGPNRTAEQAVAEFERHLLASPELVQKARADLRGKNLACWCKPGQPCHADVLLRIANGGDQ